MKRVACLCLLLAGMWAWAGPSPKPDSALEKRFRADVQAVSRDAADAWDQGNVAREAQRLDDAEAGYRKAIGLAPNVDHPHRRLCGVLARAKRLDEAARECEIALSLAPGSGYDKAALAEVLLARGQPDDRSRGASLAREAAQAIPDDEDIAQVDCSARAFNNDLDGTSACVEHLMKLAPDNVVGHLLAAQVAFARGDYGQARVHLDTAKRAGLPEAAYEELNSRIAAAERAREAIFPISLHDAVVAGISLVGGWLALLVLLLFVGRLLSKAVLQNAGHLGADDHPVGTPRERRLRRAYRLVLLLTGLLFYVSLPLLIVVVVAAALVALVVFDEMGGIPIVVLLVIIVVVASTIISILRALFFKPVPKIEGQQIDPQSYPKLGVLLEEAADAIETRRVDVVYLTPGTDAGVIEYSSLRRALFGARATRVLILGVGLFDGMKQRELRAILAHEYGHFRNADTGGGRALAVKASLLTLLRGIARSGYAVFNPAWWLLRAFTHLYLIVSSGASRLQELLADRWAIRAYGSDAFVCGLRHVVAREVEFAAHLSQTIEDVIENKWSLPNLYDYDPEPKQPASVLAAEIQKRMNRRTQFDSHPTPHQRIEWAEKVALPGDRTRPDDLEPVWELFSDPEKLERDMTSIIRDRMRVKLGVTVGDAEWEDEPQ